MVIAADYPFLNILWTMIIFFAWVVWIWIMIVILTDIFRRKDIGGWTKALWVVFLIILPFLGALIYLIAQHDGMANRQAESVGRQQKEFDSYVRQVAAEGGGGGGGGSAAEIEKAKALLDSGAITQDEFNALKAKALAA
jgi:putative oligomerization/nucleic acid binding protein/phospholipase D-like protein